MDVALAGPDLHLAAGDPLEVGAEEHVGQKQDVAVGRHGLDHCARVAGGAAVVRERLHLGGRVHVADDDGAGVLGLPGSQLVGVDRRRQRAAGIEVGDQHRPRRRQDRGRLGHEVDAAEGDHVGLGTGGGLRQPERVAHQVGDVLHLGQLVVVGEDDGVALGRERAHLVVQARDLVRGQRGHGCTSSEMSSARTEWVSAPMEIASTPLSAIGRTVSSVTPPDASSRMRAAGAGDGGAEGGDAHVVEQDAVGARGDRFVELLERVGLGLHVQVRIGGAGGEDGLADAGAESDVVVLDQDRVGEIRAMVRAAAAGDGELVEPPQARRGLARVEDLDARALDRRDVPAGGGGDARHPLQQVERGALGGQDRAGRALDPGDRARRVRNALAFADQHLHLGGRVEPAHDLVGHRQAAHDSRLAHDDVGDRRQLGRHGRLGRGVAAAGVLRQGGVDHTLE